MNDFPREALVNHDHSEEAFRLLTGSLSKFALSLENGSAIGLSGSRARGNGDALSDIDVCVFVPGELPALQTRKPIYAGLGLTDLLYEDVDFMTSRGDGFRVHGTRCDFNWMSIPAVQSFLERLDSDFDCAEYIPGGLSSVRVLHDPGYIIAGLQGAIPPYSDARAQHRIRKAIQDARFSLYDLGWLDKAAFRSDAFLFHKHQYFLLETLFRALFALNNEWLSAEKGLAHRAGGFSYAPQRIERRITSVILHQQDNGDLPTCLSNLKGLFSETVQAVHRRYPSLDLPAEWR
jgi:predicted nucleotidyltransferase